MRIYPCIRRLVIFTSLMLICGLPGAGYAGGGSTFGRVSSCCVDGRACARSQRAQSQHTPEGLPRQRFPRMIVHVHRMLAMRAANITRGLGKRIRTYPSSERPSRRNRSEAGAQYGTELAGSAGLAQS